jgi:hypothetical protein
MGSSQNRRLAVKYGTIALSQLANLLGGAGASGSGTAMVNRRHPKQLRQG